MAGRGHGHTHRHRVASQAHARYPSRLGLAQVGHFYGGARAHAVAQAGAGAVFFQEAAAFLGAQARKYFIGGHQK